MELKYIVQGIRSMPGFWAKHYLEETIGRLTEEEQRLFDDADRELERIRWQAEQADATVSLLKLVARKVPNDRAQDRVNQEQERLEQLLSREEECRRRRFEVMAGIINDHIDTRTDARRC